MPAQGGGVGIMEIAFLVFVVLLAAYAVGAVYLVCRSKLRAAAAHRA
jgi:hypothetical protein